MTPTTQSTPQTRHTTTVRAQSPIPSSAWKMAVFAATTLVLIGVLATLIGNISFTTSHTYYARFTDATGVLTGDRVRVSGVEVGTVRSVELIKAEGDGAEGRHDALLEFKVRDDIPMLQDARLELRFENIVGQRYLAIEEHRGSEPMPDRGTYPVSQTTPALNLTELFNGFQPLLRALDPEATNELSYQIVRAFQGEATSIAGLLRNTASLTSTLADKDVVIGDLVTHLNEVLTTVDSRDQELSALIVEFRDLMVGLSTDRDVIAFQLPRLARLLDGTTGLLREVRPPLARTTKALGQVARVLRIDQRTLAASLREIPRKLRFMARSGSYGSWFNFYVCGAEVRIKLLGDTVYLGTPGLAANDGGSVCAKQLPAGGDR